MVDGWTRAQLLMHVKSLRKEAERLRSGADPRRVFVNAEYVNGYVHALERVASQIEALLLIEQGVPSNVHQAKP